MIGDASLELTRYTFSDDQLTLEFSLPLWMPCGSSEYFPSPKEVKEIRKEFVSNLKRNVVKRISYMLFHQFKQTLMVRRRFHKNKALEPRIRKIGSRRGAGAKPGEILPQDKREIVRIGPRVCHTISEIRTTLRQWRQDNRQLTEEEAITKLLESYPTTQFPWMLEFREFAKGLANTTDRNKETRNLLNGEWGERRAVTQLIQKMYFRKRARKYSTSQIEKLLPHK